MNKFGKTAVALGIGAFCFAGVLRAADTGTSVGPAAEQQSMQRDQDRQQQQQHKADQDRSHAGHMGAKKDVVVRRLEKIASGDVYDNKGEKVGNIKGIVVDTGRGRIGYAVLSFGGFAAIGDKNFAIPWSALHKKIEAGDTDKVIYSMNVDENRLKNAKGFDENNWPDMADTTWARETHSKWDASPYWDDRDDTDVSVRAGPEGVDVDVRDRDREPRLEGMPIAPGEKGVMVTASDLVGHAVLDQSGKDIAELETVMVDVNSGKLAYGIVQVNKAPDFEKDYMHPVPWQLLHVKATNEADARGKVLRGADGFQVTLNTPVDKLKSGPKFAEREWPNMTQSWGEQVYSAYGVQPFWKGGSRHSGEGIHGTTPGSSSHQNQSDQHRQADENR